MSAEIADESVAPKLRDRASREQLKEGPGAEQQQDRAAGNGGELAPAVLLAGT
jgi:hypothetical protein